MNEFQKYQHLERFGTSEVEGIDVGTCYIFPKIDGTNASMWLQDGQLRCGSRNRDLTLGEDNQGFREWALSQDKFLRFFNDYPNLRLYGEWLVPHTIKSYRDSAWRNFYVFDVVDGNGNYICYDEYLPILLSFDIVFVPCQKVITNPTYEHLQKELRANTFLMENGKGHGEGIVIKNYSFKNKYGRTTWAKVVANEFKEKHTKLMGTGEIVNRMIEEDIVEKYVTKALVDKVYAKIENEMNGWSSKYIPRLLQTVYYDLVKEECWNFVKEFKQPKINFKTLQHVTIQEIKKIKPKIF